jgi:hypothetical protein
VAKYVGALGAGEIVRSAHFNVVAPSAAGVNYIAAAFNNPSGAFHPQRSAGPALAKMA